MKRSQGILSFLNPRTSTASTAPPPPKRFMVEEGVKLSSANIDWGGEEHSKHPEIPRSLLWEESSRPTSLEFVKGQESAKASLREWINNPSKAVLLAGPSGCGKTSLARNFLESYNFRIWDESMLGDDSLHNAIDMLMTRCPLIGIQKRAILIECAEGLMSEERKHLIKVLKGKLTLPIIVTCDNAFEQNLRPLKDACTLITMKALSEDCARSLMLSAAKIVGKPLAPSSADLLLESSHGNVRQALNSMQFMVLTKNRPKKEGVSSTIAEIDMPWDIFSSTAKICSGVTDKYSEDIASSDLDLAICALQHNAIASASSLSACVRALDCLSMSDILMDKHESALAVSTAVQGTSLSCRKGASVGPRIQFPAIFGKMSSRNSRKANLRQASGFQKIDKYSQLPDGSNMQQVKPTAFDSHDYLLVKNALAKGKNPKELKKMGLWSDSTGVVDILRKGVWN